MRIRYSRALTRADIGRRVVVRRWVEDDERGLVPSDVVGILEAWSDQGVLTVRTRGGDRVRVHESDVLAAKVVAPGSRARAAARMERPSGLAGKTADEDEMGHGRGT